MYIYIYFFFFHLKLLILISIEKAYSREFLKLHLVFHLVNTEREYVNPGTKLIKEKHSSMKRMKRKQKIN